MSDQPQPQPQQKPVQKHRPATRRRWTILAAALTGAAAVAATTVSTPAHAAPQQATQAPQALQAPQASTTRPAAGTAKFLGRWNYRTPQPTTGLNIATASTSR